MSSATIDPATGLQKYSCALCKERKIKCDRTEPCVACTKAGVTCIFRAPDPPKRRKRRDSDVDERKTEAEKRKIRKYEDMLRKAGVDVPGDEQGSGVVIKKTPESPPPLDQTLFHYVPPAARTVERHPQPYIPVGNAMPPFSTPLTGDRDAKPGHLVVHGKKTRYVESNLWKVVSAEASQDALESSSDEDEGHDNTNRPTGDVGGGLVLGFTEADERNIIHPDAATILRLWQIFLDNCNPIIHIIHAPTLQSEIISVIGNPDNMAKPLCAILCSIYTMAVASMDECESAFGESKEVLHARYSAFTRQALINAAFMRTSDISVLVAFVLYIISISGHSDFESRWQLSGVAMRIAQRIGVHRDPETLGLDAFSCEMRRRLWNQLWVLDIRCAEFAGCKTALPPDSENVKAPTNCSDSALFPGMKSLPPDQEGFTDMSFMLLRVKMGQFLRGLSGSHGLKGWDWIISSDVPSEDKQIAIEHCEKTLYEITRYCDAEVPIQAAAARMGHIVMAKLRWLANHPRKGAQAKKTEDQLRYALDLIEVEANTRLNPAVKRFMWHAQNTLQFDSIFFILAELRKRFIGAEIDRAWTVLAKVYEATPIVKLKNSRLFSALRHMTLAAWEAREQALGVQSNTPTYITQLRKARTKKLRAANGGVDPVVDAVPMQTVPNVGLGYGGTWSERDTNTNSSTAVSVDNPSPLYATDMDEIDWQLWDQVFQQDPLDPSYGQWMTGTYSNRT